MLGEAYDQRKTYNQVHLERHHNVNNTLYASLAQCTGDLLFDPRAGEAYDRDEDHLALFLELLGRMPKRVYEKVWRALLRVTAMIGAGLAAWVHAQAHSGR